MSLPISWSDYSISEITNYTPSNLERAIQGRVQARRRTAMASIWWMAISSAICFLAIVGIVSLSRALFSTQGTPLSVDTEQGSKIRCDAVNVIRRNDFVTVSGDVLNQSVRSLENLEVVVQLQDASHHTLQMASALTASKTLSPGRSTPFRIDITDDVKAVTCRVWFRKLSGSSLS